MAEGIEQKSISVEDFTAENGIKNKLNTIADLIMQHPKIPEGIVQSDLLETMIVTSKELETYLRGNVPEQVRLRAEIDSLKKQNEDLRDTAHKLFIKAGSEPNPAAAAPEPEKKRMTPSEITRMLAEFPFPD